MVESRKTQNEPHPPPALCRVHCVVAGLYFFLLLLLLLEPVRLPFIVLFWKCVSARPCEHWTNANGMLSHFQPYNFNILYILYNVLFYRVVNSTCICIYIYFKAKVITWVLHYEQVDNNSPFRLPTPRRYNTFSRIRYGICVTRQMVYCFLFLFLLSAVCSTQSKTHS